MELLVNGPLYILMVLCVCGRVFIFFIFYFLLLIRGAKIWQDPQIWHDYPIRL